MKLEVGKFYKTRDDRKAEVIYINEAFEEGYRVIAIIAGETTSTDLSLLGRADTCEQDDIDLIEEWVEPVRVKGWVNIYSHNHAGSKVTGPGWGVWTTLNQAKLIGSKHPDSILGQIYIDQEVEK